MLLASKHENKTKKQNQQYLDHKNLWNWKSATLSVTEFSIHKISHLKTISRSSFSHFAHVCTIIIEKW